MRLRGLNFDHHIAALQQRITALRWNILQGRTQKERAILQAFEELQTALEELHTVDEELHLQSEVLCQQNEALTAAHQMLDVERQHYQSLFDFAPDGYLVTDGTGTICEANQTACAMLDLPQDMLKNQPLLAFVVHDDAQLFSTQLQQLQRLPQMQNWEMRLQPRLGSSFPASVRVGPARHAEGEPPNLLWLLRDISERQQLEQALRESEQRFRAVFDQAAVGMAVFGMDGKWLQVNQQFCDFVGYSAEELLEQRWQQTTHPDDVAAGVEYMGRLLAGDMPAYVREKRYITKHGTEVWGKLSVSLVRDASCTPKYWIDVVEDITARKIAEVQAQQAAHALQSSRERIRQLATYLQDKQESERCRIARALHDDLAQNLAGLKYDVSWLAKRFVHVPRAWRERVQAMSAQIEELSKSVRRIGTELRPTLLDDLGLLAAIEWQLQQTRQRMGLRYTLHMSDKEELDLEPAQATAVFRIFQEALTNVVRHADASHVSVRVIRQPKALVLEISDNGKGIAPEQYMARTSLGLLGMRERATLWGGDIAIQGKSGIGTTITVRMPYRVSQGKEHDSCANRR